ncbi:MAG: hypothetical protein CMF25_04925 [Kangiellaceae bacterium]|nr:hypothetical protein [Kangiellaceae bacterium]|tara:strand:+ start:2567 stop:3043 length:477 start_codon:yes stop_codon:yes gene_type:complete
MWYFKSALGWVLFSFLLTLSRPGFAEQPEALVIVVNASIGGDLSEEFVKHLYLGTVKAFPKGEVAIPLNLGPKHPLRGRFEKTYLKRSRAFLKANWSRLLFTGKGTPPLELDSAKEVAAKVLNDKRYLGYTLASEVAPGLRIIAKLPEQAAQDANTDE